MQDNFSQGFGFSPQQRQLWRVQQETRPSSFYARCSVYINGNMDVSVLEEAIEYVVRKYEILRTFFRSVHAVSFPLQVISDDVKVSWQRQEDLSDLSVEEREQNVSALVQWMHALDFDWSSGGSLLHLALAKLESRKHLLLIVLPALCADTVALDNLVGEISSTYERLCHGQAPAQETEETLQYADFAEWQNELLTADETAAGRTFWRQHKFSDLFSTMLPYETLSSDNAFALEIFNVPISAEISANIDALARTYNVSASAVLLSCWQVLLWRLTDRTDRLLGVSFDGRQYEELKDIPGLLAHSVPFACTLDSTTTFSSLLKLTHEKLDEMYEQQEYFGWEQQEADFLSSAKAPYFPLVFEFAEWKAIYQAGEASFTIASHYACCDRFHLKLLCSRNEHGLLFAFHYDPDRFSSEAIAYLAGQFSTLVENVSQTPDAPVSALVLLGNAERQHILEAFNETRTHFAHSESILETFNEQVSQTPDAIAVVFEEYTLTYAELWKQARHLACTLKELGVQPEVRVGVCIERSLELVVGFLGVLMAGGAYVPLDPDYPLDRLHLMLDDAQAKVLLTQERFQSWFAHRKMQIVCPGKQGWLGTEAQEGNTDLALELSGENAAYILYTSGTTGRPKGVVIPHAALANHMSWMQMALPLTADDRVLQKTSSCFDASVWEFYAPLLAGAQLVLAFPGAQQDSSALINAILKHEITILQAAPSLLRLLLLNEQGLGSCQSLRRVFCGGEKLLPGLQQQFFANSHARLYNLYGPTETCIQVTFWECERENTLQRVPIGRPIANTRVYILDADQQPVVTGQPGEIYIGGRCLARGYLHQPAITAEKFVPDPFSQTAGERLYRTGDRGRFLPDGTIEYLDRIDNQVKLHGFRIEPGEVEAALEQHSAVDKAVALVKEVTPGEQSLVAYLTLQQQHAFTPQQLLAFEASGLLTREQQKEFPSQGVWLNRHALINDVQNIVSKKLPSFMLPSRYVLMHAWPLTPNGKIDLRALPDPEQTSAEADVAYIAPRTAVEASLAEIWAEVLKLGRIGVTTSFFRAGGHSLLVTQVISRVQQTFGVKLPIRSLFERPTIEQFARQIEQAQREKQEEAFPFVHRNPSRELLPLSFAQESLWFLHKLKPDSPFYNMPFAMQIRGALNIQALNQALAELVERHEVLRTTFPTVNEQPIQVIASAQHTIAGRLAVIDLSSLPEHVRTAQASELVSVEASQSFDLEHGPLMRARLFRVSKDEHIFTLTLHHIVFDGQSMDIFTQELSSLYRSYVTNQPSSLAPLAIQYADYALWQRERLQGEVLDKQSAYWSQQLKDVPELLAIPADYPRSPIQSFRGAGEAFSLPRSTSEALKALSDQEGVTLFMTVLAAFAVLLYRYTGQDDILLSTPISNRDRLEFEHLIGFLVNILVLRLDCSGNPRFRDFLARVREVTLEGYSHQDLPFELLVQSLQPNRNLGYNPLFQVHLVLQNSPVTWPELEGLSVQPLDVEKSIAKFDLTLYLESKEDGFWGEWEYSTDLFKPDTIRKMAQHFQVLLDGIVRNPAQPLDFLPLLTVEEQRQLLMEWPATQMTSVDERCVHQIFAELASAAPDRIAVLDGYSQMTYSELDRSANRLAHYLQTIGVGPEVRVAISLERSIELILAILAVFKAGSCYVPVDPAYPSERRDFMLRDANACILITRQHLLNDMSSTVRVVALDTDWPAIAQQCETLPAVDCLPGNLAYVIYTSGSTGQPKGVMISHQGLANLSREQRSIFCVEAQSRVLQFASPSFDASISEMLMALLEGATLCLFSTEALLPGPDLIRLFQRENITHVTLPPSVLAALPMADLPSLQVLIIASEAGSAEVVRRWLDKYEIFNAYGPTETTVCATIARVSEHLPPGIGRPIANTQVYVLDSHLQPVPIGVPGELYIGGIGLARGYFHRPDLTAEKFVPHPFSQEPGARLYRTGDRVRFDAHGDLEFIGRADQQVKIHGFRIEPGEIEETLRLCPAVQDAVVLVQNDTTGDKHLVAHVVPAPNEISEQISQKLHAFLELRLPRYMIPATFVLREYFPTTPNGKIDRQALFVDWSEREHVADFVAPRTAVEEIIAEIWAELLSLEKVGIHDNFFTLGGHSLIATQLNARISEKLLVELPLHTIFAAPTVAKLAAIVEQALIEQVDSHALRMILDTLH